MLSREDSTTTASDVFSRLGAGEKDPAPGGSIQRTNGKVSLVFFLLAKNLKMQMDTVFILAMGF